ncbi:MAG: PEP-CTERM sorting domain-containing protein [Planctomycetota bacterium]
MTVRLIAAAAAVLLLVADLPAQTFSGHSDTAHPIDPAIAKDDSRIVEWADSIVTELTQFAPRGSTAIDTSGGFNSLGDLSGADLIGGLQPGHLTVSFPSGVRNGDEWDFVVFENAFTGFADDPNTLNRNELDLLNAELAFVEVSSDGQSFARFPSQSLNQRGDLFTPFGDAFAYIDPTNVHNLAGKHAGSSGLGTPFDLSDLSDHALVLGGQVDLNNIQFVKLVDIPGNGVFTDSLGNPIYDAWLTEGTGGFDFRLGDGLGSNPAGIGVLNSVSAVPEPGGMVFVALSFGTCLARRRRRRHDCS